MLAGTEQIRYIYILLTYKTEACILSLSVKTVERKALTVGAVGYGVYQTAKTSARAKPKAKDTAPIEKAVFYGADIRGGTWKTVTEPMNFVEARTWVEITADTNVYGKGASWGLYTPNELDAKMMAISFGGPNLVPLEQEVGIYPHYHVEKLNLFGIYKHFHVWYGAMG